MSCMVFKMGRFQLGPSWNVKNKEKFIAATA